MNFVHCVCLSVLDFDKISIIPSCFHSRRHVLIVFLLNLRILESFLGDFWFISDVQSCASFCAHLVFGLEFSVADFVAISLWIVHFGSLLLLFVQILSNLEVILFDFWSLDV